MPRKRDNQKSLVYQWEAGASSRAIYQSEWDTIAEVEAWLRPIWRAERGRYGRAKADYPTLHHGHWGQRRALAYHSHDRISLPRWSRNKWVALHEMAHLLTPRDEAHGPRFVGVLMGLLARHAGYDVDELMASADAAGVRYHARSIGCVPVTPLAAKLERLLPTSDMDAAFELGVHWRQVRGAALGLIREGRARWLRGKLVALRPSAP
jgi:hypothetical protein